MRKTCIEAWALLIADQYLDKVLNLQDHTSNIAKQLLAFLFIISLGLQDLKAQEVLSTQAGTITFNASTPLEDIEAENEQVGAVLVPSSGEFAALLLVKEFQFPRALMQEHFNENYMESDRYPKAILRGKLDRAPELEEGDAAVYDLEGTLEIHGVSRPVTIPVRLSKHPGELLLEADFIVRPEDHEVEVPRLVFAKIAREVHVNVTLPLRPGEAD